MTLSSQFYCLLHDCEFITRCPYWHEGDPVGVAELEPGRPKQENLYRKRDEVDG